MKREQTLQAIARIEAALTRLEAAGLHARPAPDADLFNRHEALTNRHETLRQSVGSTLAELDTLIGALEK